MDVRKARTGKGWTQEHLAGAAGLDVRTIRRIEAGEGGAPESLMAIRAALGPFEADATVPRRRGRDFRSAAAAAAGARRLAGRHAVAVVLAAAAGLAGVAVGRATVTTAVPAERRGWEARTDVETWTSILLARSLRRSFADAADAGTPDGFSADAAKALRESAFFRELTRQVEGRRAVSAAVPLSSPTVLRERGIGDVRVSTVRVPFLVTYVAADGTWTQAVSLVVEVSSGRDGIVVAGLEVDA